MKRLVVVWILPVLLGIFLVTGFALTLAFQISSIGAFHANPVESRLKGLHCDLWTDFQGMSHAKADHKLSGFACLGYLHGRDRAWQMDFFKRTWLGRKSEVFGPSEIKSDFAMRLLALDRQAERIFSKMDAEMQAWLWAYAFGVNRGIREALDHEVYEFKRLGYAPGSWIPQDTIALLLLQGFDQTKQSFVRQLDENEFIEDWGRAAPALFARDGVPWATTILKAGEPGYPKASPKARPKTREDARSPSVPRADALASVLRARRKPAQLGWLSSWGGGVGQGSNNWVLAPTKSATGHAWLANDPHLELKHPPFWYWLHVQSPEMDAIGASLPGVPGIASGSNRHVAWGVTNSYLNVSRLAYVPEEDLRESAVTERPWIWIKFGPFKLPFFFKTLRRTHEGWPVLPVDEVPPGRALVLRWTGFELGPEDLRGVFELQSAKSAEEADRALSKFSVPSWNFVFADDHGKIGYRAVGRVPANKEEVPFGIHSISLSQFRDLDAFAHPLTPDEMPHVFDPKRGYVVTANNRQWSETAPRRIGRAHSESFRAYRIEELLSQTPKHDLESIRKTQCDVQAVDARFLLPGMIAAVGDLPAGDPRAERSRRVLKVLREWDGVASLDCTACPVFQRWVDRLLTELDLEDTSLYRKLAQKDPAFEQSVREELVGALDELGIGPDARLPAWKDVHLNFFQHLAGPQLFPASPIGTPGDDHSVNPGTSEWENGIFRHVSGASQRLIVELSSPPKVYSVLAGSNADVDGRDPTGGEWRKWLECGQNQRVFPMDWSQVKPERVDF